MELVRQAFKRSTLVYKSNFYHVLRHSGNILNSAHTSILPKNNGSTSRLSSNDGRITDDMIHNAIGATDELSSFIGLAREFACDSSVEHAVEHPYVDKLKRVQMILFDLNHAISRSGAKKTNSFENKHTEDLEEWILEYSKQLPPSEDYIIPGGGKASASLHVARTICKRTERCVMPLVREGILDEGAQTYLSRLCEFLLTVSRIAAKCDQRTENIYIPRIEISEDK